MRNLLTMLLVAFLNSPIVNAAPVPAFIPIQGYLTDDQNQPINQQLSLTISLYNAQDANEALFTETTSVQVDQGYFAVHLGGDSELDMNLFRDNTDLYLGISVDAGAELSPRFKLGSVPYAASAASAQSITYATPQVRHYSVNFREWIIHNSFLSQHFGLLYGNPEDDGLSPNVAALRFSGQGAVESLHAYAAFHIPHQATITGLACVVADSHTNGHIAVKIKKTDGITESNLAVAATTNSQTSNDPININDDSISDGTIDNISYSYILEAGFTVSGDHVIGGGTIENQLWLGPCTISYEVNKPLP